MGNRSFSPPPVLYMGGVAGLYPGKSITGAFLLLGAGFSWVLFTFFNQVLLEKNAGFSLNLYQTGISVLGGMVFQVLSADHAKNIWAIVK